MIYNVFFSPTRGTRKLADSMAAALSAQLAQPVQTIDLTPPAARGQNLALRADDVLLFAFPVYSGRVPALLEDFIARMKGDGTPAVVLGVYGNRAFEDALLEASDLLSAGGFIPFAAAAFLAQHSHTGKVNAGRPNVHDLTEAAAFAANAAKALRAGPPQAVALPGGRPYKPRRESEPRAPKTTAACTACGVCAAVCPTGAIQPKTPAVADTSLCIACFACVRHCPEEAKHFADAGIAAFAAMLEKDFAQPKQPSLFL